MRTTGMIQCAPLLLLLVWPALLDGAQGASCSVDQIQVQADFNVTRYAGRWLELLWLSDSAHTPADQWTDYAHQYTLNGNGNLTGVLYYRKPGIDAVCKASIFTLVPSNPTAKMYYRPKNPNANSYPFWVVSTDYTQYSLVYSCARPAPNGTCPEPRMWLWTRSTSLAADVRRRVLELAATRLCINPDFLITTPHSSECPQGSNGAPPTRLIDVTGILVACLLLLLALTDP